MSALKYWLWLTELPGLTNQTRLALLQPFPHAGGRVLRRRRRRCC